MRIEKTFAVNPTYNGTNYQLIGDLKRGEIRVGKARISFFVPKPSVLGDAEEKAKTERCIPEECRRNLIMDILLYEHLEEGWVDGIIGFFDISASELERLEIDPSQIMNCVNHYLWKNDFGMSVE